MPGRLGARLARLGARLGAHSARRWGGAWTPRRRLENYGEQNLFLKHTKCSFAERWVEYLGHFISKDGDPAKIVAMQS